MRPAPVIDILIDPRLERDQDIEVGQRSKQSPDEHGLPGSHFRPEASGGNGRAECKLCQRVHVPCAPDG